MKNSCLSKEFSTTIAIWPFLKKSWVLTDDQTADRLHWVIFSTSEFWTLCFSRFQTHCNAIYWCNKPLKCRLFSHFDLYFSGEKNYSIFFQHFTKFTRLWALCGSPSSIWLKMDCKHYLFRNYYSENYYKVKNLDFNLYDFWNGQNWEGQIHKVSPNFRRQRELLV